jgi:hypothetical protein
MYLVLRLSRVDCNASSMLDALDYPVSKDGRSVRRTSLPANLPFLHGIYLVAIDFCLLLNHLKLS